MSIESHYRSFPLVTTKYRRNRPPSTKYMRCDNTEGKLLNSNNDLASFWKNSEENVKGTTLTFCTRYLSFVVVDAWRAKVACTDLSKGWDITVASRRRRSYKRKTW